MLLLSPGFSCFVLHLKPVVLPASLWTEAISRHLCWFDLGPVACSRTVPYVLTSRCSVLPPAERTPCGAQRQKKPRQAPDLSERIQRPPGPAEPQHEHTVSLENRESPGAVLFPSSLADLLTSPLASSGPASFPDVFEDDVSSSSSSSSPTEHQSQAFPSLPGLSSDQLLSCKRDTVQDCGPVSVCGCFVCLQTAQPSSPTCPSALTPALNFNHLPRPRKPRDTKPKMRKLKYHQYIPPDQRGGSGTGGTDPSVLQFLSFVPSVGSRVEVFAFASRGRSQTEEPCPHPAFGPGLFPPPETAAGHPPNPASKPELLPANLVDLTVSELRQQLRKRGLPVSGTKPALLQRLRPFQLPPACLPPAPLCQLGPGLEPLGRSPASSSSSGPDSPGSSPTQQLYTTQDRGIPNGILSSVSLVGEHGALANAVFLAPAGAASEAPSPSLPMSSSSPLQGGTPWRPEDQQQQQQQELNVELEMRERIRTRPRERSTQPGSEVRTPASDLCCFRGIYRNGLINVSHHAPGLRRIPVFCCQPCDVIGHDFELPVQITASPAQTLPGVRSLEEELQEAIQKAQMDPRQSIDDILDEPIACVGDHSDLPPPPPPPPPAAPPAADQQHHRDDTFLPSPLCSSLLLELPPSPAVINPSQVLPAPPPPPLCTSPPPPSAGRSRKRRAPTPFDAADWLETLTSGLRPLTPPAAPFVESDFSLDSDLNVNRVLDLMIEQW
uniref:Si:dkeyp-69b9.3 n=1 Tax=Stegastes partitus TaxID=144197 RepID=A0A3B5AMJ8_9TELE